MVEIRRTLAVVIPLALFPLAPSPARAIIVFGGHDANGNPTTTGSNLNPAPFNLGAYEGLFGAYLATPIGPRYVVTASHIPGSATFEYNNGTATTTTYHMTAVGSAPDGSGLAVYKIADTDPAFTLYAPLYTGSDEVGNPLVTIGRGTARGAPFLDADGVLRGWEWATYSPNEPVTWGTGIVADIGYYGVTFDFAQLQTGVRGGLLDNLETFGFARTPDEIAASLNTGIFSAGDSGGATFVRDPADGIYKLAGINFSVDFAPPTPTFGGGPAALFDASMSGPFNPLPQPLASYATRISTEQAFLGQYALPGPTSQAALEPMSRQSRVARNVTPKSAGPSRTPLVKGNVTPKSTGPLQAPLVKGMARGTPRPRAARPRRSAGPARAQSQAAIQALPGSPS